MLKTPNIDYLGIPSERSKNSKYNRHGPVKPGIFLKHGIPEDYAEKMAERVNMAHSKNTKSNYMTVKNNIERCEIDMECELSFPWGTGETLVSGVFAVYKGS